MRTAKWRSPSGHLGSARADRSASGLLRARGQVSAAVADATRALEQIRGQSRDAHLNGAVRVVAARCFTAEGRDAEAEELRVEALAQQPLNEEVVYDLPLHLAELGRGDEYIEFVARRPGFRWRETGLAVASGDPVSPAAIYAQIGAPLVEAWARLLAAERGETKQLEPALICFRRVGGRAVHRALSGAALGLSVERLRFGL